MTKRTTKTKEEEMELRRKRGYQSVTRNNKKSTKLEAAQNHLISKLLDDAAAFNAIDVKTDDDEHLKRRRSQLGLIRDEIAVVSKLSDIIDIQKNKEAKKVSKALNKGATDVPLGNDGTIVNMQAVKETLAKAGIKSKI